MFIENLKISGNLNIVLTDAQGVIKQHQNVDNLVVTTGKNWIASRLKDAGIGTQMGYMGLGSGTNAANATDTALQTALVGGTWNNGRVLITNGTGAVSNNTIVYEGVFGAGVGSGAVTEAGMFNATTAGTMLCRTVFSVVNKSATDILTIQWTVTIS